MRKGRCQRMLPSTMFAYVCAFMTNNVDTLFFLCNKNKRYKNMYKRFRNGKQNGKINGTKSLNHRKIVVWP